LHIGAAANLVEKRQNLDSRKYHFLLGQEAPTRLQILGHCELGSDVSRANVFGERSFDGTPDLRVVRIKHSLLVPELIAVLLQLGLIVGQLRPQTFHDFGRCTAHESFVLKLTAGVLDQGFELCGFL
jgi:hypothetical protein